ncbi:MAG TPA: phosphatase PAP2 family protein [Candidatus Saccharimonadales bacterium]|nr:phosphatase PAP2 family protein [Candidatus Saccharimonadales bacterium]
MQTMLHRFDDYFTDKIQAWPTWLHPLMRAASFVGYPAVTLGAIAGSFFVVGWVVGNAQYVIAAGIIAITHAISSILKKLVGRQRPATYITKRWHMKTHSFPSGHACGSVVAYGAIAVIVGAPAIAAFVVVLVSLIGISRIYLGAHYPSDVVAGWLIGILGLMWLAAWV